MTPEQRPEVVQVEQPWRWWAGSHTNVVDEAIYEIGNFATREEAILAGQRETYPGGQFDIIEARLSEVDEDDPEFDPDYGIPFLESRNHEVLTNGPSHPERRSENA